MSPLIWSFANVSVPPETSSVLPEPTVIFVPSIVPPLISVVVNTELSNVITPVEFAIVPAAVPSLAFRLVISKLVESKVVAFTFVMFPVVEPKVVIVIALIVPPSTLSPLIWSFANVSVPAETSNVLLEPTVIFVPSIVPPLISVVVNTELSNVITPVEFAIVPAAVPSLAFRLVISKLVESKVVAFTFVMFPVVEPKVLIVIALIVPPSTLSPLIWSFANVSVPAETFSVLPEPTVISVPSIVPPSILAVVTVPKSAIVVPLKVEFFPNTICSLLSVVTNFK